MKNQGEDLADWYGDLMPATTPPGKAVTRKPRILIAGEFSSGKTQLVTGLIGSALLPSNVVATALPPVWLVAGTPALCVVDLQGAPRPVAGLSEVAVAETLYCIASDDAAVLRRMDIIDTPGNSDPNIPAESWQRMLDFADVVVWCTNATQAWRQSEKSVWQAMPERLRRNALLLVTHGDLMADARSADRVMRRVQREAGEFFAKSMLVSLLEAQDLASIAAELDAICDRIGLPAGAENPVVDRFAADHPLERAPETGSRPLEQAVASLPVPPPCDPAEDVRAAVGAAGASVEEPLPPGRARSLWTVISAGRDLKDARTVLAAVDALIAALDVPAAPAEPQYDNFHQQCPMDRPKGQGAEPVSESHEDRP